MLHPCREGSRHELDANQRRTKMLRIHHHVGGGTPSEECCRCHIRLCMSLYKDGVATCNLEEGHNGDCENTLLPQIGKWKKNANTPTGALAPIS